MFTFKSREYYCTMYGTSIVVDVESRDANDGLKDAKGQGFHKSNC